MSATGTPLGLTDWLTFFASFGFVVSLIALLYFLAKRLGTGALARRPDKAIEVLETQVVGNRQRIVLMRARNREFLVGMTPTQITALGEWSAEEVATFKNTAPSVNEAASAGNERPPLADLMARLKARK